MAPSVKAPAGVSMRAAVVDIRLDIRALVEDALDKLFPQYLAEEVSVDWDRFYDRDQTLDEFWLTVKTELQEA